MPVHMYAVAILAEASVTKGMDGGRVTSPFSVDLPYVMASIFVCYLPKLGAKTLLARA